VYAFWWPRFVRVARWFIDNERTRRPTIAQTDTEVAGEMALGERFTLSAKADRIDRLKAGGLSIIDYKTGTVPIQADIARGFAPQLPLEAMLAAAGCFKGIAAQPVARLAYWRMTGAREPGEEVPVEGDPALLAADAEAGLRDLIAAFADPATPYPSQPDPAHAPRFSDYEHLARVREWSAGGGEP
jgi:ATP-dependent helicase/nuclease subunit B